MDVCCEEPPTKTIRLSNVSSPAPATASPDCLDAAMLVPPAGALAVDAPNTPGAVPPNFTAIIDKLQSTIDELNVADSAAASAASSGTAPAGGAAQGADGDLVDAETVDPKDIGLHGVCISVPMMYVDADEAHGVDQVTSNLRVLPYERLHGLMLLVEDLPLKDYDAQVVLCKQLTSMLVQASPNKAVFKEFMEFVEFIADLGREIDLDESYVDITNDGISFDVIRNYCCDPVTGILASAEPQACTPIGGDFAPLEPEAVCAGGAQAAVQLYSQLPTAEQRLAVRKLMNDTDFNRMQYCLSCYEKTMLFRHGFLYSKLLQMINLTVFYLVLLSHSRPIKYYCHAALYSNLLGYIFDVIIRSRLMQAWQNSKSGQKLLFDLIKNHDGNNFMVCLAKLKTARERATYLLNEFRKAPGMQDFLETFNYDSYLKILERFKRTIEGRDYYVFDNEYIYAVGNVLNVDVVRNLRNIKLSSGGAASTTASL